MRVAGAMIIGAALLASGGASAQGKFDGNWSVLVSTQKGDCDTYRWPVIVQNGVARYGGPEGFDVTGRVTNDGRVNGALARGGDRANMVGRLSGGFGQGTWTASGSRTCSGVWQAERRG